MAVQERDIPPTPAHCELMAAGGVVHDTARLPLNDANTTDTIYFQQWVPADATPAAPTLLYVHGMGDYSGRFAAHVHFFLAVGWRVAAYDHYGHGMSSGQHGFVPTHQTLVDGLRAALKHLAGIVAPRTPVYLLGESMGGLVVLREAVYHNREKSACLVAGVVAVNPLVRPHADSLPPAIVVKAARRIASWTPTLALSPANKGKNHPDPAVERDFYEDAGTYSGWLRVGTGVSLMDGIDELWRALSDSDNDNDDNNNNNNNNSKSPSLLVLYGSADRVTDPDATVEFVQQLSTKRPSADIKLTRIDGGHHVLVSGPIEADSVFGTIVDWLQRQASQVAR